MVGHAGCILPMPKITCSCPIGHRSKFSVIAVTAVTKYPKLSVFAMPQYPEGAYVFEHTGCILLILRNHMDSDILDKHINLMLLVLLLLFLIITGNTVDLRFFINQNMLGHTYCTDHTIGFGLYEKHNCPYVWIYPGNSTDSHP